MIGRALDERVDLVAPGHDAPRQPAGILLDGPFGLFALQAPGQDRLQPGVVELELEQDLEGALPGGPPFSHPATASRPSSD